MPVYKAKNQATGEEVTFNWTGKQAPTPDDVSRISDQQRQSRIQMRESQQKNEPSFMDKILMSKPVGYLQDAMNAVVPRELPGESIMGGAKDVIQGNVKAITGQGPEQYPRVAGVRQAVGGIMRAAQWPLTVAGLAVAPGPTLAGLEGAHFAQPLIESGVSKVMPNAPPEVQGLVSDAGTLGVGAVAGGAAHALGRSPVPTPEIIPPSAARPMTTEVGPPRYGPKAPPPRTGVDVEYPPVEQTKQIAAPVTPPPSGPVPEQVAPTEQPNSSILTTQPPAEPVQFPVRPPQLPAQMPEPVNNPPEPPPSFPPRVAAPGLPAPAFPDELRPAFAEPLRPPLPEDNITPPAPQVTPEPAGPIVKAPEVEAPPDAKQQGYNVRLKGPAVQFPEAPTVAGELPQVKGEELPAASPPKVETPKTAEDIARDALNRARPQETKTPEPTPEPETQKEETPEPPQAEEEEKTPPEVPLNQVGPNVEPPVATPQEPPNVESPYELAKRATQIIKDSENNPPVSNPMTFLQRMRAKDAAKNAPAPELPRNEILDFIKKRGTGTIAQIQEQFGIPGDQVKTLLQDFEKRGLTGRTANRWVYKNLPEESSGIEPPSKPRPFQQKRQEQIENLQQQVKDQVPGSQKKLEVAQKSYGDRVDAMRAIHDEATKAGMTHEQLSNQLKARYNVKSMKDLTHDQMREVEDEFIEKRNSSTKPKEPDRDINARIDELEEKQDTSKLSPDENEELNGLYKQLGFWRSERGTERIGARLKDAQENMGDFLDKFRGATKSTDLYLEEHPSTRPIANIIKRATMQGDTWEASQLRKMEKQTPEQQLDTLWAAHDFGKTQNPDLPEVPAHATLKGFLEAYKPESHDDYSSDTEIAPDKIGDVRELLHRMKVNIFEKPASKDARDFLGDIPDKYRKDMAQWYIDNWTRRDLQSSVTKFLRTVDRKAAAVGGRAVLFGSSKLQVLHLARLGMQVWPEMGTAHTMNGLGRFISHPQQTWNMIRDYGLLPQSRIPWSFKTPMEKFDYTGNFGDLGNSITKAIAFEANMAKFKGNIEKSVNETKRVEGMVGRETPIRGLEYAPRSLLQFRYWLGKYLGNVTEATRGAVLNPNGTGRLPEMAKLGRYIAAGYLLKELSEKTGITLWHLKGSSMFDVGGPTLRTLKNVATDLGSDKERHNEDSNVEAASKHAAKGVVPGGTSLWPAVQKMIEGDSEGALHALGPFEKSKPQ